MGRTPLFVLAAITSSASAGAVLYGPSAYLSDADSPFAGLEGHMLEDFEDGVLNIDGVSLAGGSVLSPNGSTDSVDGDDGVIDGSGTSGWSWFNASGFSGVTVTFNADIIGSLPTYAGIVWTDGGGAISFEAFNAQGDSLGLISGTHGDGSFSGTTGEDRFYGINDTQGIASFRIWNTAGGIEVDHVQYAIPASGTAGPFALLCILAGRRRR